MASMECISAAHLLEALSLDWGAERFLQVHQDLLFPILREDPQVIAIHRMDRMEVLPEMVADTMDVTAGRLETHHLCQAKTSELS